MKSLVINQIDSLDEAPSTFSALIWLVNGRVLFTLVGEPLTSLRTSKLCGFHVTFMLLLMSSKIGVADKLLATFSTREGILGRVDFLVIGEVCCFAKMFSTFVTRVWFVLSVNLLMLLKVRQAEETFAAVMASVPLGCGMNFPVPTKTRFMLKMLSTLVTRKWPIFQMDLFRLLRFL